MSKTGRNESCPCGSGKKFKKCCEVKQQRSRMSSLAIAVVAAMVLGALLYSVSSRNEDRGSMTPGQGRVWSAEHGHWH